jgi:hypothetical protein
MTEAPSGPITISERRSMCHSHAHTQVRNGLNEWSHRDPDDRLADRAHMRVIRLPGCWGAMRVHPLPLGGQQPARNWLLHRRVSSRSGRKPMSRRVATDVPNVVRPLAPCGDHQDLGRQDLFSAHVRCQGSLGWQLRTERQNREYRISPQISRAWQARCPPKIWEDMSSFARETDHRLGTRWPEAALQGTQLQRGVTDETLILRATQATGRFALPVTSPQAGSSRLALRWFLGT